MLSRFSNVWLFVTPWAVACHAPLSTRFSRQEYWSGLPYPPPGDLPNPGIEPTSCISPALADMFFTTSTTWEGFIDLSESEVAQSCPSLWDPWTVARQAPLSMGFSRLEYWSGLPCPPPGDLPDPGIKPASPMSPAPQADFYHWATEEVHRQTFPKPNSARGVVPKGCHSGVLQDLM